MWEERVVFGERAVLLSEAPARLPARVLLPGSGSTVQQRVDGAVDPVGRRSAEQAAAQLGIRLAVQDPVDIDSEARLCPPTDEDVALASAMLELGCWRYRIHHTPPGPELAALLDARPDRPAPAPGTGEVIDEEYGNFRIVGRAVPADPTWADTVLSTVVARTKLIAHLQGQQYRDVAALSACYPGIHQFLATELAMALHVTDSEAAALLGVAEHLRDKNPDTLAELEAGRIDDARATAIVRATLNCSADTARAVEQAVLPEAGRATPLAVRRRAGRAVIAIDPDGAVDRHRAARADRHMSRRPDEDGMATLTVRAAAQDVDTIWRAVTASADTIRHDGDTRTLGNRRVDALVQICADILGAGGWAGLKLSDKARNTARVAVTVPYPVLLGEQLPCELVGHGPITSEQALDLVGSGELFRLLCDPVSGQLLDYGHTRYKPPPHLAAFVRARDQECPSPSCHHPADRGDIDHVVPARPDPVTGLPTLGTTSDHNLAPPCPHHHHGKDAGRGFVLHRARDGTYTWTTPLGRVYTWRPDPLWHPDLGAAAAVAACDCPETCTCQRAPEVTSPGEPTPVVVDGDWADQMAQAADHIAGPTRGDGAGEPVMPCEHEVPGDGEQPRRRLGEPSSADGHRKPGADAPPF
jgi:hypothetical protein